MDEAPQKHPLEQLSEHISAGIGDAVVASYFAFGELTLIVARESWVEAVRFLRDDPECKFINFIDLCGADYPEREDRFDVVLHLMNPHRNTRIRIKTEANDMDPVPSISELFAGADWFEREAYDLYGILFSGHADLRRILTDYGFDGHPLRKDFPLTGFVEVRYDEERRRVVYEPVRLPQEFRSFDYLSPWEGTDYVLPGDEKAKS
ncbi:NADH-quinone oxidoreductase subunit C [Devosia pacifica]|uniref:NADH-quinone oxidoreductase subunit C n=1 Tax=Devosia pacifica TaxID=1335967 RepID=A0A918RRM4_9HYPH|nr:NADH-quinone oxidoreductase subunit C [Devosia pacifica]GHA10502.1 NADH-quinone oxidoreductase subunit C [Devosia pacifica]